MSKTYLKSVSTSISPISKWHLIWNYWDHEHIVGTHFLHYKKVNIVFEQNNFCFSERWAQMFSPFGFPYPFYFKTNDLCILTNDNRMDVFHSAFFDIIKCHQTFIFEEKSENETKVTRYTYLQIPKLFKFLQPLYDKMFQLWFDNVWEEDLAMRERRVKLWNMGFVDFKGLDYVNDPNIPRKIVNKREPYVLKLPIPKITQIKQDESEKIKGSGSEKTFILLFKKSKHIGYGLPDL